MCEPGKSLEIKAKSSEFMDIKEMKRCINQYLDLSDNMVRTIYEVLFLEHTGHKVEIRVHDSDSIKEDRQRRKLEIKERLVKMKTEMEIKEQRAKLEAGSKLKKQLERFGIE